MSDVDSLLVTFQTQLSDVMETVLKTAMYEVTRLVEEGILEEVKRRGQEVQSLTMRLQWTERKLSDEEAKGGERTGRCVDCAMRDAQLASNTAEEKPNDLHDGDLLRSSDVKREGSPVETWTEGHSQGLTESAPLEEDDFPGTCSSLEQTQAPEEEELESAVDVKEESLNSASCLSVNVGGWNDSVDGKAELESQSAPVVMEKQPKQSQENSEMLLTNIMRQVPLIPAACGFPEEPEDTRVPADPSHVSSLEMNTSWAGFLPNHSLTPEKDRTTGKTRGLLKPSECETFNCPDGGVSPGRDQSLQSRTADSDRSKGSKHGENKDFLKCGIKPLSWSVKQHRSSAAHKHNHIYHKATSQELMKLHPKAVSGLKLQTAIHLHRPVKRKSQTLSNSATAALAIRHSQMVNLNTHSKVPSTSKTSSSPAASAQRLHQGNRQAASQHQAAAAASWVGIRSQPPSPSSDHPNPGLHPDLHTVSRHLLHCSVCGKCFPHPSNLKAHLQTHTGERPFCCSLCGRSFTKLSNLKAHRRVHTGERPYCCLACGKRFTQKCNLKRHQRIHVDV